jgi:glycosyltransferase involved in cell wall biosynthesis
MKRTLIMPAYNASKVFGAILDRVPSGSVDEIIVIDDGSKDNTYEVLAARGDVVALRNQTNQGYGGAQIILHREALTRGADVIILMHADGGHTPEELPAIVSPVLRGEVDVSVGSRMEWLYRNSPTILGSAWLGAAFRGQMPTVRFLGTELTTFLQNLILGTHYNVFHSGFRAMSRDAVSRLDFEQFNRAYLFDTEVLVAAHYAGMRIAEIPTTVHYDPRAGSTVEPFSYGLRILMHTYRLRQRYGRRCHDI